MEHVTMDVYNQLITNAFSLQTASVSSGQSVTYEVTKFIWNFIWIFVWRNSQSKIIKLLIQKIWIPFASEF